MIPLSIPNLGEAERRHVMAALDSGWVSTAGPEIAAFEREMEAYTGATHAIALNSGTAALHLALLVLDTQPGDIVLVPNLTFAATLNAVAYVRATPLLVDIDPATLQMDARLLADYLANETVFAQGICRDRASGARVRAIMPVHVLGYPCNLDAILALAQQHGLPVVEDAAAAIGVRHQDRHLGTYGLLGTLSFNGNKVLTTGGGGMLLTHDPLLAAHARHLAHQAKSFPTEYIHDSIGYNYGMTNLAAAMGRAQLGRMGELLQAKEAIHLRYKEAFADSAVQHFSPPTEGNHWLEVLMHPQAHALEAYLNGAGIMARKLWVPMAGLPMHKQARVLGDQDHAGKAYLQSVCIPSSSGMALEEQLRVIDAVKAWVAGL